MEIGERVKQLFLSAGRKFGFISASSGKQSELDEFVKNEYLGKEKIKFTSFKEIEAIKNSKRPNQPLSCVPSIDQIEKNSSKETLFHIAAVLFSKREPLTEEDMRCLQRIGSKLAAQKPIVLSQTDDHIHQVALQHQYTAIENSVGEMARSHQKLHVDRIKNLIDMVENITSSYAYGRIPGKFLHNEEYLTLLKTILHLFEIIRGHDQLKFLIGPDAYTRLLLSKEYLDQASPIGKHTL